MTINTLIFVDTTEERPSLKLINLDNNEVLLSSNAFIGRNGVTSNKIEGDGKTPLGTFKLGVVFGIHDKESVELDSSLDYVTINENLYWVDDANSRYYNKLVDISKVIPDWNSAEHLIDYKVEYEYAIEIKVNPESAPLKGSAIFLHCSNNKSTAGCVAIAKKNLIELLKSISNDTIITIK